jgi:VWFA-related protein
MKRRLAALLTCALMAFGQRSRPVAPPAAPAPNPWVVDAVALDASGRPVADLAAEDFEVVQGGRARQITNFTWFDTRLHTAVSRSGQSAQLPALNLLPDEIRRNLVVVVDDLGLTPGGINAVRSALRTFLGSGMSSSDRMAILRSSGGSGVLQQLTGDTRILGNAIDGIRYLGGGISAASAGRASWLTLRYALDGLRDFTGRKVVVLFSENPGGTGPSDRGMADATHAAHAAAAAVYAVDPLPEASGAVPAVPSALESLARDTGGLFGADFARVLENEQGYYAIGFQPEDSSIDASGQRSPATPAVIKVRRPGVVVRARAGYVSQRPRVEFPAPVEHAVLLHNALASPFAGIDIRASLTAVFSEYPREGPSVDAIVHFDLRDFSFIHDFEDMYQGTAQLWMAAYTDDGRSTIPLERDYKLTLRPAEYRYCLEYGLSFSLQMNLPAGPGAWQIRAVVADGASDRIGSATQFVETPNVRQGSLALSGLILSGASPAADRGPADPRADSSVRIFKPGQGCTFLYGVFNALTGPDKQSTLEAQTRIFAEGRLVLDGKPGRVTFGEMPGGSRRQISGQLKLDPLMVPGDYILQVTVRDLLAPPGQPRRATQFTDFQVRQ